MEQSHGAHLSTMEHALDPLKAAHNPNRRLSFSVHGGTEEWRRHRAFKAKMGERLRMRFKDENITDATVEAWFIINHKKILIRDFETAICELGFNRGSDGAELAALFDTLKRNPQEKFIYQDAVRKALNQLKQAAEAAQQEARAALS